MIWQNLSLNEKYSLILYYKEEGKMRKEVALILGISPDTIWRFCLAHDIDGWPIGGRVENTNARRNEVPCKKTITKLARKAVMESGRSLFICEQCKYVHPLHELHCHHKDRDRLNNTADNLKVLCDSCHAKEHSNERKRNELGQLQ